MKKLPSYNEQFNKITEAYIRGEIKPLEPHFCFCGTLCGNTAKWFSMPRLSHNDYGGYKGVDFVKMERALLDTIYGEDGSMSVKEESKKYEELLFSGMVAALEVLKQIHVEHGEVIDNIPTFTKRSLNPSYIIH